uniref:THAP-type domain-containing protein n=1 Tax=Gadus morhua TaxID=8049 RepID=A0A8C5CFG6_GADMO
APQSFKQFPVRDPERTQLWLVAAGLDINTPAETVPKLKICSDHFRPDDFEKPCNLKSKTSLKTNAVPSVFSDAPTATDEQVITFGSPPNVAISCLLNRLIQFLRGSLEKEARGLNEKCLNTVDLPSFVSYVLLTALRWIVLCCGGSKGLFTENC